MMRKILLLLLFLSVVFTSCEYNTYDCYTFEIEKKTSYVPDAFGLPYRPTTYEYYDYSKCGLTSSSARLEAREKEYTYTYYYGGYYITEDQRCTYWQGY